MVWLSSHWPFKSGDSHRILIFGVLGYQLETHSILSARRRVGVWRSSGCGLHHSFRARGAQIKAS